MEVSDTNTEVQTNDNIGNVADPAPADTSPSIPDDLGNKDPASGGEPEQKEWKPNLKVKAYDKEFDIPEKFHALINKENEKDFRDAFEKAFALDVMKEKNAKIRESNEQYQAKIEKEYMPVVQRVQKLEKYIANNDYDSFFANIPAFSGEEGEKKLQAWMLRRLQLKDLPPDQQALYNESRAAQQRAYALEEENSSYKQKFEEQTQAQRQAAVDQTLNQLDSYVSSPGVVEVARDFDSRLGQDGSFKLEVLRRAAVISQQQGRDVTVEEAVNDFLKVLGKSPQAQNSQNAPQQKSAEPKPTLPSLNGKATSPATQKIKSMDDLRKLSKQVIAQASRNSRA